MRGVKIESSNYYLRSLSALDDLDNYLFWMSQKSAKRVSMALVLCNWLLSDYAG